MGWGVFLACWAVSAAIALALGRDTNWDLRNYHYYNVYALLEGRWGLDLTPARAHSFLYPGLDIPFYLLTQSPLNAWPRLVSVLQTSYGGLLGFLVIAVTSLACHGKAGRVTVTSALAACFGFSGAATLPEIGSTYNDIQVDCLVLGALLALLVASGADDADEAPRAARLRLLAGFLGGCAVGLKLTAAIFPPALALVVVITARRGVAPQARALALLTFGGALGFLVAYGPWGWFLWERFGNPFGAFSNNVFRSSLFPLTSQRDERLLPDVLFEALIYPFIWARRSVGVVLEPALANPRFAVGLSSLMLVIARAAWRRRRHRCPPKPPEADPAERSLRAVLAFVLVSYVIWLGGFSILRYAIPVEVLLGIPVWAAARDLLRAVDRTGGLVPTSGWRCSGATVILAATFGGCALVTLYPAHPREAFFWEGEPRGAAVVAVTPLDSSKRLPRRRT
jgi:hypothetical protein